MIMKLFEMFLWLVFVPYAIGMFLEEYRSLMTTDEEFAAIDEDMIRRWNIAKNPLVIRKRQLEREGVIPYMRIPGEDDFDEEEKVETNMAKALERFGGLFKPGHSLMLG